MFSDCMASLKIYCQIADPSWTNGQTERANQSLKSTLRSVAARLPSSWASHLPWVEYAHNSLICSTTGFSPFMVNHGFQPLLFPSQEASMAVSSVQAQFRRVNRIWHKTRAAFGRTEERNRRLADRECVIECSSSFSRLYPKTCY